MTVTTKSSLLQGRSCKISRSTMKSRLASITWWSGHPSRKGCSIVSLTPSLICQKHTSKVNIYQHFQSFLYRTSGVTILHKRYFIIWFIFISGKSLLSSLRYSSSFFKRKLPKTFCIYFLGISVQSFIREWFILLILCHPKKMSLLHRLHPFKRVNFQILYIRVKFKS